MNKALRYLFWGYFFIFFRIQIGIDWLADPIGYLLIASGCLQLLQQYPQAKKARMVAMIGAVISIPAVFVNLSVPNLGMWESYSVLLFFLKLIIAYFLFTILKSIVNDYANQALIHRTKNVYSFYIAVHLASLLLMSFSMNMPEYPWLTFVAALAIGTFIMDIAFLLLLGAIRRAEPHQTAQNHDFFA
ncbi:hypothetical protein [Sporosarcina sp. YIM B06819]|uniref:hypothetical protein n=1 Tax=Sporosarcina sp. YIM B06819 TaxID=3081769 RepID=UPI00298C3FFB|nr:hypothetical protein [Sporosarcina sp. YIM B06819]